MLIKNQISDKRMLPMGHQSPVIPTIQSMPEILPREAIITSTQSHIQNQLQMKHQQLQKLIMKQQEELQLVSQQLHLAQRGMLPVVSSTQMESQYGNRQQGHVHPHQIDKMGNNAIVHRTVLRFMENSPLINNNEQQTYMEQPINQAICHTNAISPNPSVSTHGGKPSTVDQLPQVHSSQDFQRSKSLLNFDDTNQASMSPATPASISSTIGAINYASTSD